jgi:hypothetical protein
MAAMTKPGVRPSSRWHFRLIVILVTALLVAALFAILGSPAQASTHPRRYWALKWAESKAGCWYSWGGSSCSPGFDCSGIVMSAYAHEGISLPHSTYSMLSSWHLYRIPADKRQQGDLAFYGTGHVELVTRSGTFGALDAGSQVGWHKPSAYWHPSAYYRVRW